jgi:BMFP domain-containing protein YqiC
MAKARKTVEPAPLAAVRTSLGRMQTRAERLLKKVRRDAEAFITRSRGEVVKDLHQLERRVLKAVHAATREDLARLERRVAKLESTLAGSQPAIGTGGERAA